MLASNPLYFLVFLLVFLHFPIHSVSKKTSGLRIPLGQSKAAYLQQKAQISPFNKPKLTGDDFTKFKEETLAKAITRADRRVAATKARQDRIERKRIEKRLEISSQLDDGLVSQPSDVKSTSKIVSPSKKRHSILKRTIKRGNKT